MSKNWRCLIGRHDWREVQAKPPDRDKYAECARCGKHDWQRLIARRVETKFRGGGDEPPGFGGPARNGSAALAS